MAEFLIKAIDTTNPNPDKDASGCYKRGDIVEVYEDGRCTEPPSPNSKMVIVKIPGVSKAQAELYAKPVFDANFKIIMRRKFKLRLADIPLSFRQTLVRDRQITVSLNQIKTYIRNKKTGMDEA